MSNIFKNETYSVDIKDGKYVLTNNETGVEEFDTSLMPEAIHYAIELQNDLYKLQTAIKTDAIVDESVTH